MSSRVPGNGKGAPVDDPCEHLIERSIETEHLVVDNGEPVGFLKREERPWYW